MAYCEDEPDPERAAPVLRVCQTPSYAGEEEKQGQEVGKGRVRAVVGGFGLFLLKCVRMG